LLCSTVHVSEADEGGDGDGGGAAAAQVAAEVSGPVRPAAAEAGATDPQPRGRLPQGELATPPARRSSSLSLPPSGPALSLRPPFDLPTIKKVLAGSRFVAAGSFSKSQL
jgi:hypothetical protein